MGVPVAKALLWGAGGLWAAGVLGILGGGRSASSARCGVHGPMASKAVQDALLDTWEKRGYPRDEARRAVAAESGWHAEALNCNAEGHPVAGGLIQFLTSSLHSVGFSGDAADFASLPAEAQLPYCQTLVARLPKAQAPGDARLALFWPAAIGQPDSYVIARPDAPKDSLEYRVWKGNPGLRVDKTGPITAGSVRKTVLL